MDVLQQVMSLDLLSPLGPSSSLVVNEFCICDDAFDSDWSFGFGFNQALIWCVQHVNLLSFRTLAVELSNSRLWNGGDVVRVVVVTYGSERKRHKVTRKHVRPAMPPLNSRWATTKFVSHRWVCRHRGSLHSGCRLLGGSEQR